MRTIAIHTSKGGVGKTTLTVNLAYEIARLGNRVLVIDLDEQGNSSLYLGVNEADRLDRAETLEAFNQILEGFRDRKEIIDLLSANFTSLSFDYTDYIYSSSFNKYLKEIENAKIDVIPSSYRTKEVGQLTARIGGTGTTEKLLNRVLKKIGNEYDYVLMDTSPNLTPVTKNALFAARHLIIPTQLEYFQLTV
jgi:chromosome partitioning protein